MSLMECIIDCRNDNRLDHDFLTLNIWGKPVFAYPVEAAIEAKIFNRVTVVTNNRKALKYIKGNFKGRVAISDSIPEEFLAGYVLFLSGRAACLTSSTLRKAAAYAGKDRIIVSDHANIDVDFKDLDSPSFLKSGNSKSEINAFAIYPVDGEGRLYIPKQVKAYTIPEPEDVVINRKNDFELAIVLKKKQNSRKVVEDQVRIRISEKIDMIKNAIPSPSICFVGHSQLDYWTVDTLGRHSVRNCGIAGISSFEYSDYILKENLLNCSADAFLVMHGTNDIVWDYTMDEITGSVMDTIKYIKTKNDIAPIYFLSCIHTNGRMDRSNHVIDELNQALYRTVGKVATWIDTSFLDDEFGDLKAGYTVDGLHLSEAGYERLKLEVLKVIK